MRRSPFTAAALALTSLAGIAAAQPLAEPGQAVRYDDEAIIRVNITSLEDLRLAESLMPDMWSHHAGIGPVDFRATPEAREALAAAGIDYTVLIPDLQARIDAENARLAAAQGDLNIAGDFFADYRTLQQASDFIDDLVAARPDLATRLSLGQSLQGREIFGIRITGPGEDKPAVFFHGCQHAREWITVMVPLYIAEQLITQYDTNSEIRDYVDSVEFLIVPVANPDGYQYSWTNERLWRKNRRGGYGVDLNRNWGYEWGGPGSSRFTFSETYRGDAPFSEPETQVLRDFINANPNIEAYCDVHSYSQLILWPWGYTSQLSFAEHAFDHVGHEQQASIFDVHGEFYTAGPTYTTIYPASGVACDWVYGGAGALGFSYELRDTGQFGFILPPGQIIPNGEEILPAILDLADYAVTSFTPLNLNSTNLVRGQQATLTADTATPGAYVAFAYSVAGAGSTFVPLAGTTLDLASPILAGVTAADGLGVATLSLTVPNSAPTVNILIQAAEYDRTSNVVQRQIQ